MIWKAKNEHDWRRKFAFLPIEIDGYWLWLEFYDVTGWYVGSSGGDLTRGRRYPSKL